MQLTKQQNGKYQYKQAGHHSAWSLGSPAKTVFPSLLIFLTPTFFSFKLLTTFPHLHYYLRFLLYIPLKFPLFSPFPLSLPTSVTTIPSQLFWRSVTLFRFALWSSMWWLIFLHLIYFSYHSDLQFHLCFHIWWDFIFSSSWTQFGAHPPVISWWTLSWFHLSTALIVLQQPWEYTCHFNRPISFPLDMCPEYIWLI